MINLCNDQYYAVIKVKIWRLYIYIYIYTDVKGYPKDIGKLKLTGCKTEQIT